MQTKFAEIANRITTIKSNLAEAISEKGVYTESKSSFDTMIENISNIASNGGSIEPNPEIEEWVKPDDWIDIESQPLEEGEVRVLMCDLFGKEDNSIYFKKRSGATNIKATIDWGDGIVDQVNTTGSNIIKTHTYENEGIPSSRGYNMYVVTIKFNEPEYAPEYIYFYRNGANSKNIVFNNLLWIYGDMRYFTVLDNLTCHFSYYSCSVLLERANLINTSHILSMNGLFSSCYSLVSIPQLDTTNTTSMNSTFLNCYSLKSIPVLNTSNVTIMNSIFGNCHSLISIPILDTSNATNITGSFGGCFSLKHLPKLNTSKVTNMYNIFVNCYSLESIGGLDTSSAINTSNLFYNCHSLKSIPELDTRNAENMSSMFYNCYSLEHIPKLDTSKANTINLIFCNCSNLKYIPEMNTSNVTNIASVFSSCRTIKRLPSIDTRKCIGVNNNKSHFANCNNVIEIGTIILSEDISIEIGSTSVKPPLIKIDVDYDKEEPPVFTQTVPIKINYTQLPTEQLNKLMNQLPDGNGKTLDLRYNRGSLDCDPSIATAKNWTVLVK